MTSCAEHLNLEKALLACFCPFKHRVKKHAFVNIVNRWATHTTWNKLLQRQCFTKTLFNSHLTLSSMPKREIASMWTQNASGRALSREPPRDRRTVIHCTWRFISDTLISSFLLKWEARPTSQSDVTSSFLINTKHDKHRQIAVLNTTVH